MNNQKIGCLTLILWSLALPAAAEVKSISVGAGGVY
jgi:hypothetical protein